VGPRGKAITRIDCSILFLEARKTEGKQKESFAEEKKEGARGGITRS